MLAYFFNVFLEKMSAVVFRNLMWSRKLIFTSLVIVTAKEFMYFKNEACIPCISKLNHQLKKCWLFAVGVSFKNINQNYEM